MVTSDLSHKPHPDFQNYIMYAKCFDCTLTSNRRQSIVKLKSILNQIYIVVFLGALLKFKFSKKTYLIVIKDETGLKSKINDSTLFLIGSYAQKLVASYSKMGR